MKSLIVLFFTTVILASNGYAGIIFETGTGPFDSTACCGSSIAKDSFIGTTFSLTEKTKIDAIGGHFRNFDGPSGSIFGAIVELDQFGLPTGTLTGLSNVLAYTTFNPLSSVNTFASVDLELDAGIYGLIFGSGLFGADGHSALTLIQPYQVSNPKGEVLSLNGSSFLTWGSSVSSQGRYRMFVSGTTSNVSEPSSLFLLVMSSAMFFVVRRTRKTIFKF